MRVVFECEVCQRTHPTADAAGRCERSAHTIPTDREILAQLERDMYKGENAVAYWEIAACLTALRGGSNKVAVNASAPLDDKPSK